MPTGVDVSAFWLQKLFVAPLVPDRRAIVEKIVASTQNTGPKMLGQTGV
jgi:hypothetical protein